MILKQHGFLSTIAIGLFVAISATAGWVEYSPKAAEKFVISRKRGFSLAPSLLTRRQNGELVFLDTSKKILRKLATDGSIREFTVSHLGPEMLYGIDRKIANDEAKRRRMSAAEPFLFHATAIDSTADGVLIMHRVPFGLEEVRVVQLLNSTLAVSSYWEDRWPALEKRDDPRDAVAIAPDGNIFAEGEKGEILRYSTTGTVTKRLVIPGVFNSTRVVPGAQLSPRDAYILGPQLAANHAEEEGMIADQQSALLVARDAALPTAVPLTGETLPVGVMDLAVMPDGKLILLDGTLNVFKIDPSTAACSLIAIPDMNLGPKEPIRRVEVGDAGKIFLSTAYEIILVGLSPTPTVLGRVELAESIRGHHAPWVVISISPPKVTFADQRGGKMLEIEIPISP